VKRGSALGLRPRHEGNVRQDPILRFSQELRLSGRSIGGWKAVQVNRKRFGTESNLITGSAGRERVELVHLVCLVQPNKPDKPNKWGG
jgi:hypothetical protein